MKLGAFLKQYLKQSLQAFKHPKQLLPTIILTVVWIILGLLQIKLKENLPMKLLNFITYAQGGLYGGVVSAIGGILGKVVVAGFVNALIAPLFMGKKPFNGLGNGFKELGKSLSLQSRKALASFLKGLGAALILYGLSNTTGSFENSMAGIMAAVSLALAMGKKNGFLWNFACSYAQSVTKGKTPDYTSILRALTGMTLGFALGVGMHAAGIGLVGIVGVVALLLGWILGWGSKKEAVTAMVLIALTLMPAPETQAAKKKKNFKGAWVLVELKDQETEEEKTYALSDGVSYTVPVQYGRSVVRGRFEMSSKENRSFLDLHCNNVGYEEAFYYPGQSYSSGASIEADDNNTVSMSATLENYVIGAENSAFKQPKKGADGNYTFVFPTEQEIGTRNWSYVIKWTLDGTEAFYQREYVFEWTEIEIGNWVLKDQKINKPETIEWQDDKDWLHVKSYNISYDAGQYSFDEETQSKSGYQMPGQQPVYSWSTGNKKFWGTIPTMEGPYKAGEEYLFPNDDLVNSSGSESTGNMWDVYMNQKIFCLRMNGEALFNDRLTWRDMGKNGYKVRFPTHERVGGDVLEVQCVLALAGGEINHTYIFTWDGAELDEDEKAALAGGGGDIEEDEESGGSSVEEIIDWIQDLLDNGEHTEEEETVLIDLIAGLLAGGAAAGAGATGGGMGGGPFGGDSPDGGKSEEEKEWERKKEEYDRWERGLLNRYTKKNPDGTVTVIDPATGETSTLYPTDNGGLVNENGSPITDNDLANWLDDHERNSDYHRQNAATAERNLEKMRKDAADEQARVRRGEKSDMEKAWEKRKKEIEDARKKEEIGQKKDYYDQLADKYKLDKNSADLKKDIKKAILKERLKALKDLKDAEAKDDAYTKAMQYTKRVQAVCDISFAAIGTFGGTTGKTGQTIYVLLRNTLGRTSESYSKKDSLLKGATKGAVEGGLEVGVGLIDNPIVNTAAAGIKQAYSSWLDGDSLGDAAAKIATACALQGASNVIGNWVTSGQKSFVQDQWKLSYGDAPGAGAMYLEGVDNAVKVALTVGKGVKFVGETFVDLLGRYIEGDE